MTNKINEFVKGSVEETKEHNVNPALGAKLAHDHVEKIPDYYTRLEQMVEKGHLQKNHKYFNLIKCVMQKSYEKSQSLEKADKVKSPSNRMNLKQLLAIKENNYLSASGHEYFPEEIDHHIYRLQAQQDGGYDKEMKKQRSQEEDMEKAQGGTINYSDFNKKKVIKPAKAPIDYSKIQRPIDSTTGSVPPLHNPIQHMKKTPDIMEKAQRSDKEESCIQDVKAKNRESGIPPEGTESGKGNPWAICRAALNKTDGTPIVPSTVTPQGPVTSALSKNEDRVDNIKKLAGERQKRINETIQKLNTHIQQLRAIAEKNKTTQPLTKSDEDVKKK